MTQIDVRDNMLTVTVEGIDRLLALRRRLQIPLDHIVDVDAGAGRRGRDKLAAPIVSRIPPALAPRTFYQQAGRAPFRPGAAAGERLVIDLYDERYRRLVLQVEDARGAADAIRRAVAPE